MCDGPRVYTTTTPKARRRHTCCECGTWIHPGESYELTKGNWDGKWSTYKTCSVCVLTRDWFANQNSEGRGYFTYRGLFELMHEGFMDDTFSTNIFLSMCYRLSLNNLDRRLASENLVTLYNENVKYKLIRFTWPFDHSDYLIKRKWAEEVEGNAVADVLNEPRHTLLCVAPCGGFDITAIINDHETLADFRNNTMDNRPKKFLKIQTNLIEMLENRL